MLQLFQQQITAQKRRDEKKFFTDFGLLRNQTLFSSCLDLLHDQSGRAARSKA
jgi:hypothetical protein